MASHELNESLHHLVSQAATVLNADMAARFREANPEVTVEMWNVLNRLWVKDGQTQQELANQCRRDKSTIARILDNMVRRGLVSRVPDPADRRNNLVHLTPQGREVQATLLEPARVSIEAAQHGIRPQDLDVAREVLWKLLGNFSA
jgi:DNA-binding MarR family transcriptional regulator